MINKYRIAKPKMMELALETLFYNGFVRGEYFKHDGKIWRVIGDPVPDIDNMVIELNFENTEFDGKTDHNKSEKCLYRASDIIQGYSNLYDEFDPA